MNPQYFFIWIFFFLEITFCGLSNSIFVGADSKLVEGPRLSRVHRDHQELTNSSSKPVIVDTKPQVVTKNDTNDATWLNNAKIKHENQQNTKMVSNPPESQPPAPIKVPVADPVSNKSLSSEVNAMVVKDIVDPNFPNKTTKGSAEYDLEGSEGHSTTNYSGQPQFDDKAIQRALMVCGGLAAIMMVYFALKFALLRKRKVDKRYGRIESEMDLLDEIEDDGESEEEDDTLFDLNSTRRSQF